MTLNEPTARLPLIRTEPPPVVRVERDRLEMPTIVGGSVLAGALIVCLIWWWTDPLLPRENVVNIIFMTVTSAAVVTIFYGIVSRRIRASEKRLLAALNDLAMGVESQGQSVRTHLRDVQWQIADGCETAARSRRAIAMQLEGIRPATPKPRTRRKPTAPRTTVDPRGELDRDNIWLQQAVQAGKELERQRQEREGDETV